MKVPVKPLDVSAPLLCAAGVALGAYASHLGEPEAGKRLGLAALFAFGHGLALLALGTRDTRWSVVARWLLLVGVLLFAGSLASAALLGLRPVLSPAGGILLIAGWLLAAADFLRAEAS